MSKTPRTDAYMAVYGNNLGDFARQLEAENAELREALDACLSKGSRWHPCDPVVVNARALLARIDQ